MSKRRAQRERAEMTKLLQAIEVVLDKGMPTGTRAARVMMAKLEDYNKDLARHKLTPERAEMDLRVADRIEEIKEYLDAQHGQSLHGDHLGSPSISNAVGSGEISLANPSPVAPTPTPDSGSEKNLGGDSAGDRLMLLVEEQTQWMEFAAVESRLVAMSNYPPDMDQQLNLVEERLMRLSCFIRVLPSDPVENGLSVKDHYRQWLQSLRRQWQSLMDIHSQRKVVEAASRQSTVNEVASHDTQRRAAPRTLMLPKSEIVKFDGTREGWLPFRRDMQRLLEAEEFSETVRFGELLKAVEGCKYAWSVVKRHSKNYDLKEAAKELVAFYEEPTRLLRELEEYTRSVKCMSDPASLQDWEDFYVLVLHIEEQLDLAKAESSTRSRMASELRKKFPQAARYLVEAKHTDFGEFKALVERLWKAEMTIPAMNLDMSSNARDNNKRSRLPARGRIVAAVSSSTRPGARTTPKVVVKDPATACVFCPTDQHVSKDCPKNMRERRERLYAQKLCYRCLVNSFPHHCEAKCPLCRRDHHLLLCYDLRRGGPRQPDRTGSPNESNSETSDGEEAVDSANVGAIQAIPPEVASEMRGTPVRQLIRCYLMSQGGAMEVRVFLDPGAEVTLINPAVARRMHLYLKRTRGLMITGPGCSTRLCQEVTAFQLVSFCGTVVARVQAYLYSELEHVSIPATPQEIIHLAEENGVHLSTIERGRVVPDIIIGVDFIDRASFTATECKRLSPSVVAFRLPFGWALRGFYEHELGRCERSVASYTTVVPPECMCSDLRRLFGIFSEEQVGPKSKLEVAYDAKECRFVIKLPWVKGRRPTTNFGSARSQALALRKRLVEKGLLEAYHSALSEFEEAGYAELAAPRYLEGAYYLPHHPVVKMDAEKTKVRPVFNGAAATRGGYSLNQCLTRGLPINCNLLRALLNLRLASVPVVTDLVKAFLQIRIAEEDRDFLRFFWFRDLKDVEPSVFRMRSLLFGANCSPNVLGAVLLQLFSEQKPNFPRLQNTNVEIYVDDVIVDVESLDQVEETMDQLKQLLAVGSFTLHEWVTTDEVRKKMPHVAFKTNVEHKSVKCLGVEWDTSRDELMVKCDAEIPKLVTRRTAMSFLARLYDPLDLTLPFKVKVRMFCRRVGLLSADWDQVLPEELKDEFMELAAEVRDLRVVVPRRTRSTVSELVIFTDASTEAYGVIAYVVDVEDNWVPLCAKGRLTPVKPVKTEDDDGEPSIHRYELCAAVLGAEMYDRLSRLPRLSGVACSIYCDSQVTLYRIRNETRFHPEAYIQNRLDRIRELTDRRVQWRYVSSHHNPADQLTHPLDVEKLMNCGLWWNGPSRVDLLSDQAKFSKSKLAVESKPEDSLSHMLQVAETTPLRSCAAVSMSPPKEELSDEWARILALPYDQAYQEVLTKVQASSKTMEERNQHKSVSHSGMTYARVKLWRAVQRDLFRADYEALRRGQLPKDHRLRKDGAFLDEWRVIRVPRDVSQRLPYTTRFPIVLERHPMLASFVQAEHLRLIHPGINQLDAHLRDEFRIYGLKKLVVSLTQTCRECNRARGPFFSAPRAPLPDDRTTEASTPFTSVGLDYFGPVMVIQKRKVYGLIFSCNRTRAIHLEPVTSLTTANCILAIQRFVARRGIPEIIRSDNATTFKAANESLSRLARLVEEATQDSVVSAFKIKWLFNAPRAAWWGGTFERLIGTVKRKLVHIDWTGRVTLEMVWTVFCELEAIINSRPLVGQDTRAPPLTPAHFLVGRKLTSLPSVPALPHPDSILEGLHLFQELLGEFWHRWTSEYIRTLRREYKRSINSRAPEIGELVLVEDAPKPRNQWPLGHVKELYPGRDGIVRKVKLEMMNGGCLDRAVQSLVPLEATPTLPRGPREYVAS